MGAFVTRGRYKREYSQSLPAISAWSSVSFEELTFLQIRQPCVWVGRRTNNGCALGGDDGRA